MSELNIYHATDISLPDYGGVYTSEVDERGHKKVVQVAPISVSQGRNSAVGLAATKIVAAVTPATRYVTLKAASANTAIIYVGGSNVTANTADATDGFELKAGESLTIDIDDVSKLYIITATATQAIYWIAV